MAKNPFPKMTFTVFNTINDARMWQALFDRLDYIIEQLPDKRGGDENAGHERVAGVRGEPPSGGSGDVS